MKTSVFICTLVLVGLGCNNQTGTDDGIVSAGVADAPYVIWSDPMPDAVGPNIMSPNNVVKIRFSHLMDTRSVIHATSLSPSNESVFIDTNRAGPVEGTTFDFPLTPLPLWWANVKDAYLENRFPQLYPFYYPSFKVGQKYTITVDTSAYDIYGNRLVGITSFSFTPEPYFRVTDTYPLKNDTAISPLYPNISVRFNANVDTSTIRESFALSPQPGGQATFYPSPWGFSWYMVTDNMLAAETKYTATISSSAKDVDGHLMPSPYSFSFTTAPYLVTSAYPTGSNVGLNSAVTVYCNFAIDSTTIDSSFSINPLVTGKLQYNLSNFSFGPTSSMVSNTLYTVTVSGKLRAKNGTLVKKPYTFSFTTGN